jgi:outer membrane protein OmpA-like peptidoglycan-associated protein
MMVPQFSGSALAYQGKVGYHKALNDQWKLDVGMSILAVQSDDFDGWSFDGEPADAVLSPSIGITYVFGNGADRSMSEMTAMELINSEMELDGYATKDDLSANAKSNEEVIAELRESLSQFVSEEELDAMIAEILKNSLDTTLVRGELKAVISVYFDFDSYALSSKFQNEIGEFFGTNKDAATRILIVGYADKVGTDEYNYELKQNRIKSVTDLITTKYGVDASMITTQVGDVKLSADSEQYLR